MRLVGEIQLIGCRLVIHSSKNLREELRDSGNGPSFTADRGHKIPGAYPSISAKGRETLWTGGHSITRRKAKIKGRGNWITRSLDKVGPAKQENHVAWRLERLESFCISFLLRAVYDTLPTPTNLHRWGMREDSLCSLRGSRGALAHILVGCKTALSQERYRWRHDKVLSTLADILEQERRKKHRTHVVQTSLRPDVVIWSEEAKRIILIEQTVPWEDGCEEALERKATKYKDLVQLLVGCGVSGRS
ncbi:Nitric oxide reductase transcription regulator NorR1 [Labeo rohita]|uniref:Nitric oxide reductase transcription regulator NorR1 n=1 Tax=Labeo rohita TaxID=84645 RepID=A0ABQ8MLS7_LABRO|nr:Nitric oxide reductase transcription regulator NorR1 [Labeo rohita]